MKRFIFLVLAVLLLNSLAFSGGGGQKANTSGSSSSQALAELGFKETGYPIVTKPYALKVFAKEKQRYTEPWSTLEQFKKLEAKTGIRMELEHATVDWPTQKPLLLASNDLPDVFFSRVLNEGDVTQNLELFVQLDDLITKYAPNIKTMFREEPDMERIARTTAGRIYGLPVKWPNKASTYQVMPINRNWLDKLGLKMPTTTDELYTVLKAFKERDPNGNGLADEIPATFLGSWDYNRGIMNLMGPFGIGCNDYRWITVINGKVVFIMQQDGFRDGTAWLHKLYSEGLLDQETFTQDKNMIAAKCKVPAGQPEIVGLTGNWGRNYIFGVGHHYDLVMPLKGPKGLQVYPSSRDSLIAGLYGFEITRQCKNPEIAIRWVDTIYDPMTSLELYYGPEGQHYKSNTDGTITVIDSPKGMETEWEWVHSLNTDSIGWVSDALRKRLVFENPVLSEMYADKDKLSAYYPNEYYPELIAFTPEENSELALLTTDIVETSKTRFAEWVTKGGVDREYDAWMRQLNVIGLPRMLQIYQTAYDRYMKK